MPFNMGLTIEQCRAARALLGWSAANLATACGLGIMTVKRFEGGQAISASSLEAIAATLATAGVSFIAAGGKSDVGGVGVRLS
jgi:transcriptional regulator with XRE-family HTH domain